MDFGNPGLALWALSAVQSSRLFLLWERYNFCEDIIQGLFTAGTHVHKTDTEHSVAIGPLDGAAKQHGKPANVKGHFDGQLGLGPERIPGPQPASPKAQVNYAAMDIEALPDKVDLANHIEHGIVMDGMPEVSSCLRSIGRRNLRFFFLCHCPHRQFAFAPQCPGVNSHGRAAAGCASSRPFNRSYSYRSLVVPKDSL